MVVSISSSQGMPVDARQVVFGHLHNKSLTLSHCGRKCGYRNVVCEKMWFCRKIRVFFGQNHILFTKMNFEILQPLFCEIYSIVVMIMTQTTFKCEKKCGYKASQAQLRISYISCMVLQSLILTYNLQVVNDTHK